MNRKQDRVIDLTDSISIDDLQNLRDAIRFVNRTIKLVDKTNVKSDEAITTLLNIARFGLLSVNLNIKSAYDILESIHFDDL